MAVRPAQYKRDNLGRGEKSQIQLAKEEQRKHDQDQQRKAIRRKMQLANGVRILSEIKAKGGSKIITLPKDDTAPVDGGLSPRALVLRDIFDAREVAQLSRPSDNPTEEQTALDTYGNKYRWEPDLKRDNLSFEEAGFAKFILVWSKAKPEAEVKKAA
jgi:hypothetical protein